MAECVDDLSKSMTVLSTGDDDDHLKELGLADDTRAQLRQIENDYESIFSWDIKRRSDFKGNLLNDHIDFIREKFDIHMGNYETDVFDFQRFCLQLTLCYELFASKSFEESFLEIERTLKYVKSCKFDDSTKPYIKTYNHIAWATYAYITLTLNRDSEKILKSIEPVNGLNQIEKAAMCGVKAELFLNYPPKGNDVALKFAEEARSLDPSEFQWIKIWLTSKGRVRRFYDKLKIPDADEIHAADILRTKTTKPRFLLEAAELYINIAKYYFDKNTEESKEYFKLSSVVILKAIKLSKDNLKELCCCLMASNQCPREFFPEMVMKKVVQKLINVSNGQVYEAVGKYFFKYEKDYEKAKLYFSRGMAVGNFSCSLDLIKTQCIELTVDGFPFIDQLKMIYDVFPSPKRRLIILSQILIFYFYHEDKPKELMSYLKLYMDQEIDDKIKKQQLISAWPCFKLTVYFKKTQFLNNLLMEVKYLIKHPMWTEEEKSIINDTYLRCYKMSRVNLNDNTLAKDIQPVIKKNNKNIFKSSNHDNWRKQHD